MKVFISVDIGGTCGATGYENWHYDNDELVHQIGIMNGELQTVCDAINDIESTSEIVIKDSFGDGTGVDISKLPANTSVIRGWDGGPLGPMQGINDSFDMTMLLGYNREAYTRSTCTIGRIDREISDLKINGAMASEFLISYYTSLYFGVPVKFVSGDKSLCDMVEVFDSQINTVYTVERIGASVISDTPEFVNQLIFKEAQRAISNAGPIENQIPEVFEVEIEYRQSAYAYRASFYPGTILTDPRTIKYSSNDFMEVLRLLMFI
ncbi:MAG: M55 family metallopeptidase [Tissierellia bacterium]|nr:M55 family metallopeptidase [Tissierellia bacterium]